MRISRPLLALVLTAALPVASSAAEQPRSQKSTAIVSVGDFAVMLSRVSGNGPVAEAKAATAALARKGVPLGDPKAPLSEMKLAEIMSYYGVKVTTSTPLQAVSPGKAERALQLLATSLGSASSAAGGASTGIVPAGLEDCLALSNHGQCEGCCKALGGSANGCSKTCFEINKGSAGEPLP